MTFVKTGLDLAQAASFRLPVLFASCTAALMLGEGALRVVKATVGSFIDNDNKAVKWVKEHTPTVVSRGMSPFGNLTNTELASSYVALAVIGIIGSAIARYAFNPAPALYNQVLSVAVGPIRINDAYHPAITWAAKRIGVSI